MGFGVHTAVGEIWTDMKVYDCVWYLKMNDVWFWDNSGQDIVMFIRGGDWGTDCHGWYTY